MRVKSIMTKNASSSTKDDDRSLTADTEHKSYVRGESSNETSFR